MLMLAVTTFGENVRKIRERTGLTQAQLADRLGIRQPSVWKWENDKSGKPTATTLFKLSNALKCSLDELLDGVDEEYGARARAIQDQAKAAIERAMRGTAEARLYVQTDVEDDHIDVSGHTRDDIPVIAEGDASPQPELFWDNDGKLYADVEDRITRPYDVRDPRAYGVRVRGDSMVPIYRPGQELVVSPNTAVADGDEVYVQLLSGERLLKIAYKQSNGWVLESANLAYKPRFVLTADVGAIHPILWARRKRRGARVAQERRRDQPHDETNRRSGSTKEQRGLPADHPDDFSEAARENGDPTFNEDDER